MILFLTYHKVLPGVDPDGDFYSIQADQLEHQLELVKGAGFILAPPSELLSSSPAVSERNCVLSFDDGTRDHLEIVVPVLERHRCRALFFIPTAKLNRPGYVTEPELSRLCDGGHTMGSHSHEHRRLDRLPEEAVRGQLELSQQILTRLTGAAPLFFAPPGGFINPLVRRVALESGFRAIRTMRWGYNQRVDLAALECIPINRHTTDADFGRALAFRGRPLTYGTKEFIKRVIPSRAYESLRPLLFRLIGRSK